MIQKYIFTSLVCMTSLSAMSLDAVLENALTHNNSLKQTEIESKKSDALRSSTQSKNFGRFDLIANYDHYNNARTLAPLTPMDIVSTPTGAYEIPATNDLFSAGVAYNVILFDGFAQKSSYKISDIAYQNSLIKTNLAKEELIYNAKSLYVSLLALQKQLKAQKLYTASQKKLMGHIEDSYKLGSKSKLDFLKAQNSYQEALSNEKKMLANSDILKASLVALMGGVAFDTAEDIAISFQTSTIQTMAVESLQRYKLAKAQNSVAQKQIEKSQSAYYPVIDFGAYYGTNFGPNATTNTTPPSSSVPNTTFINEGEFNSAEIWQVGLHLKWNLYDFGVKSSFVESQKLDLVLAQLSLNDTKLNLQKNYKIARSKLALSVADYEAAVTQYALLSEIAKAEAVKYESNAITLDDLLDTQAKELLAKAKMINAKYESAKAEYYIEYLNEKGEK